MDTASTMGERAFTFDGLIVDLDGVVWRGGEPIPGSAEALRKLRVRGIRLGFLTNDPSSSRAEYAERLTAIGVPTSAAEIVTSASALAGLILRREGFGWDAYVIGSAALKHELSAVGLRLHDGERGREAKIVAVGGHTAFNYEELRIAAQAVLRGARLYGAGRDTTFPMPDGPWPATGSILAAVETAASATATVAGKPEAPIFELARSLLPGCRHVAVVGDRLDSDIEGGKRAGLTTILVLTGTTTRADLRGAQVEPDAIADDLADVLRREDEVDRLRQKAIDSCGEPFPTSTIEVGVASKSSNVELIATVRSEADRDAPAKERARRIADLVRTHTGRRWVGVYRVASDEVVNLAWSGPAPPIHPRFPTTRGLTGAAIASRDSVVSNDVAGDPRYLTALESTGSELIVPVLSDGIVVGTLDVEDERTDAFGDDDQKLFEQVAQALTCLYLA